MSGNLVLREKKSGVYEHDVCRQALGFKGAWGKTRAEDKTGPAAMSGNLFFVAQNSGASCTRDQEAWRVVGTCLIQLSQGCTRWSVSCQHPVRFPTALAMLVCPGYYWAWGHA